MSADDLSNDDRVALAKEYSELTGVVERIDALRKLRQEIQDLADIIKHHVPGTKVEVVIHGKPRPGRILGEAVHDPESRLPRTDA